MTTPHAAMALGYADLIVRTHPVEMPPAMTLNYRRIIPSSGTQDHFRKADKYPTIPIPYPVARLRYCEEEPIPPVEPSRLAGKGVGLCTGGG